MPKLTNNCVVCGAPILKSRWLCNECQSKRDAQERERQSKEELLKVRVSDALLWEHRRYEIAKCAMGAMLSDNMHRQWLAECVAGEAVRYADALIDKLKSPTTTPKQS